MTLMAATDENEAPTVKKAYTYNSSMYERATRVTSCSAAQLKNYFNDNGGTGIDNIYMYIREDVDWMEITYDASGKLTPKGQYSGDLDADTDFAFTFECIDKYGASVKTTATFTVKSRIYKPVISEREINIKSVADSTIVVRKAIADIFDNTSNKKCTFVNTLNVSENNLFTAEIVSDSLVITVSNYVEGNATIELTQVIKHNTASYGEKTFTATIPVVVEKAIVLADSIALDATEKEVLLGEEFTLVATVLPANTTNPAIVWATSNDSVATVVDGKVVAVGVGEATITVATTDGSNLTATCRVVVKPILATSIALDIVEKEAHIGEGFTLTATVLPTNTTNPAIAWSTSDSTIATVADGKVVAIGVGEATITVATTDGSNLTATCRVVVKPILATSITLNEEVKRVTVGEEFKLIATVLPTNTTNAVVTWTSSDDKIATVDAEGNVKALQKGTIVITATTQDGSNLSATCEVTIDPFESAVNEATMVKVYVEHQNIIIDGAEHATLVSVYTVTGTLIASQTMLDGMAVIPVPRHNVYIVKLNNETIKVVVK